MGYQFKLGLGQSGNTDDDTSQMTDKVVRMVFEIGANDLGLLSAF